MHRFHPGRRPPHLCRMLSAGKVAGRSHGVRPYLPSLPGQRQPVRPGRGGGDGKGPKCPGRGGPALLLPLSLLPHRHRPHHLAGANEANVHRIRHGLVLALLGDSGALTYKSCRRGDAAIDRAMAHVLKHASGARLREFTPYGYDERQFCSPGFNLPVGCLMRSPNGTFPEYHSSGDNLGFIKPQALARSLRAVPGGPGRARRRRQLS